MNNRKRKALQRQRKIKRLRHIRQLDHRWQQRAAHREAKKLSK